MDYIELGLVHSGGLEYSRKASNGNQVKIVNGYRSVSTAGVRRKMVSVEKEPHFSLCKMDSLYHKWTLPCHFSLCKMDPRSTFDNAKWSSLH